MEKDDKTIYLINLMIEMLPNYEQSGIYRVHSFHLGKLCELSTFVTLIDSAISFDNKFGPRQNLSSGFPTMLYSNKPAQLQRLARILRFRS